MNCQRCGGLMVVEEFCDLRNSPPCFGGLRCLLCGEIVDQVIESNRLRPPESTKKARQNVRTACNPSLRFGRTA